MGEENTPEKLLEKTLQALASAIAERNGMQDDVALVCDVIVQQLMATLPEDSYTQAHTIAVEKFDFSLHAESVFLKDRATYSKIAESVNTNKYESLSIFEHTAQHAPNILAEAVSKEPQTYGDLKH